MHIKYFLKSSIDNCFDAARRFGTGVGIGLSCGTAPACVLQKIATIAEWIPERQIVRKDKEEVKHVSFEKSMSHLIEDTVIEEVVFRGVIQSLILKRLPAIVFAKMINTNHLMKDRTLMVARVVITSTLFSGSHYSNDDPTQMNAVKAQMFGSFIGGLCLGCIKESRLGLSGAVGGHVANNLFVVYCMGKA